MAQEQAQKVAAEQEQVVEQAQRAAAVQEQVVEQVQKISKKYHQKALFW